MSVATDLKVLDYGDHALLLQLDSTAAVLALTAALREADLPGVVDIVPASRTVLIKLESRRYQPGARQRLENLRVTSDDPIAAPGQADVVIDVVYDGPDLAEVGRATGLGEAGVVTAHTGTPWRVGFSGFSPGFACLVRGEPRLEVPQRGEPRTRVPAGSVGLAGGFCGVYPRKSPGDWQLIGRTDAVLWDIERPNPALLIPGMSVQFREVS